jgi:LuxR family maltose regulon positive regulatory protein
MLLTTKLYLPRRQPQFIARPRLLAALDEGLQGKLILVCAAPGSGKTTLVVDWLSTLAATPTSPQKSAWLSLDEQDNDPVRFLAYFVAALQRVEPGLGRQLEPLLAAPTPPPLNDAVTLLLNEVATLDQPFVLALDDYHLIHQQSIHQALTLLVEQMPPAMRLVLISRADPPFPLARWRVRRLLTEVREHDLRFNGEEVAAFLHQMLQVELAPADIAALEQRTEGWIAGLQLVALSLNGQPDVHEFVQALSGSHAYIVDYLTEEVLQRQSEAVERFLLSTAILNRLSAPLCAHVLGLEGGAAEAQQIIEQLERNRLFVVPLDSERRWFRYHHLFAEVLRGRLRQTEPARLPELHRRASSWFAQQGLCAEAIDHATQACDWRRAADLIEAQAHLLVKQGEHHTLASWIEQLPPATITERPRLAILCAQSKLSRHELDAAAHYLQAIAPALDETQPQLYSEFLTLRASLATRRNDFTGAVALASEAINLAPPDDAYLRGRLMVVIGIATYYLDRHEESLAAFAEGGRLALLESDLHTALHALCNEALVLSLRGELRRAVAAFRQLLRVAQEHGADHLGYTALVHGHLANLLFEINDLQGTQRHLELAEARIKHRDLPTVELEHQLHLAKLYQARGEHHRAIAAVKRAQEIADTHNMPPSGRSEIINGQVRLWLAYGNLDDAMTWARACGLSPDDELETAREPEYIALARVLIAQGEASAAILLLVKLQAMAERVGRRWVQIELLALLAVAHTRRGAYEAAYDTLSRALRLGLVEGYIRSFVLVGDPLRTLLLAVRSKSGDLKLQRYIDTILAAFPPANLLAPGLPVAERNRAAIADLVAPLTERELEVLRLVATGCTDRQIAERLVVVVGTAKRHLNNIYHKLMVHSRTQALLRARELGLLPDP